MCIIAYNKTGAKYDEGQMSCAYLNNHDGVGIMWREEGKVKTYKALLNRAEFMQLLQNFIGVPHVLHLRWATHGGVKRDLCHPFVASHEGAETAVWLMHNGIVDVNVLEGESDTSAFARKLRGLTLKHGVDALFHPKVIKQLEDIIGVWNKMVLMADDGRVAILNEFMGHEDEVNGIWYSNVYSLAPKKYTSWISNREIQEKAELLANKVE